MMRVMLSLAAFVVLATGCSEGATLTGNGLSMAVTCWLLWSTVNLNRPEGDEESCDGME